MSMHRAMLVLIPLLSVFAWAVRPDDLGSPPTKLEQQRVLNLIPSGHVQPHKQMAHAPETQLGASSLAQLAEPEPVVHAGSSAHHPHQKKEETSGVGEPVAYGEPVTSDADLKKEEVMVLGKEMVTEGQCVTHCDGATDVLKHLVKKERHVEVACMIGGSLAFLIALICVSIWIGMSVKPRVPGYWKNGSQLMPFSISNAFDDEYDVTEELLPVVQKLVDMTTIPDLLGVGHDAAWQTHKRFKVTKVMRIESGRHWNQYATAKSVTPKFADSLKEMPEELRKDTEERWKKIEADHAERENDPVVGPFLKKLGLDRSRNEKMLFHGSPLAGARNRSGEVIFPTEAQAPMNAIKKTGFDERLGSANGMLGSGTYFGDAITKADSYAGRYHEWPDGKDPGSVGEVAAMFLARVAVGCPYITNQSLEQLRRPPCLQGHFDASLCGATVNHGEPWNKKGVELEVCEHARCDSVIADPPMIDNHPWATAFREFVLYEKRCYPEYLFYYERLDAEK